MFFFVITNGIVNAPVAQLDRAPDFESVGCRFDSYRAHQSSFIRQSPAKFLNVDGAFPSLRKALCRTVQARYKPDVAPKSVDGQTTPDTAVFLKESA